MKLELQILVTLFAALSAVAACSGRSSSSSRLFGITRSSSCGSTTQRSILDIRGGAVHESSTIGDLESKIQSAALQNKLTIIDFTATWCGPCKMIAPVFKELSEEYGSRAQFIKVDVDDNPEAAQKYGVTAMPTFLFIKGGEVVDRLMVRDTSDMSHAF
jgi:thioredoxin 1